jgi:hypothetical protein
VVKINSKSPAQLTGGPGRMGRKLPRIPISIRIKPRMSKKISIVYNLV